MIRLVAFLWLFSSPALAAEYRRVGLENGREVLAEIVTITAKGMELKLPQGTMLVPANAPAIFNPLTADDYRTQPAWKVVVLPFVSVNEDKATDAEAARLMARRVLEDIPAIRPMFPEEIDVRGRESDKRALSQCGTQLQCATRLGEALGIDVVVMGEIDRNHTFHLAAVFVRSPAARQRIPIPMTGSAISQRKSIYEAQYTALFLEAPPQPTNTPLAVVAPAPAASKPAPAVKKRKPATKKPPSKTSLQKMAWMPVPGLPAAAQKDMTGFGASLAVAGAGAAAGVAISGSATTSTAQFVTVSLLSSYTATVLANHLFGLKK